MRGFGFELAANVERMQYQIVRIGGGLTNAQASQRMLGDHRCRELVRIGAENPAQLPT